MKFIHIQSYSTSYWLLNNLFFFTKFVHLLFKSKNSVTKLNHWYKFLYIYNYQLIDNYIKKLFYQMLFPYKFYLFKKTKIITIQFFIPKKYNFNLKKSFLINWVFKILALQKKQYFIFFIFSFFLKKQFIFFKKMFAQWIMLFF